MSRRYKHEIMGEHRVHLTHYRGAITVYCHHDGVTKRISTGICCADDCIDAKGYLNSNYGSDYPERNSNLNSILKKYRDLWDEAKEKEEPNYVSYIIAKIKEREENKLLYKETLSSLFDWYLEEKSYSTMKYNTKKSYTTMKRFVESFELHHKIDLNKIDLEMAKNIIKHLQNDDTRTVNYMLSVDGKQKSINRIANVGCHDPYTINRKLRDFRRFIRYINIHKGISVKPNFYSNSILLPLTKKDPEILSQEEINGIKNFCPPSNNEKNYQLVKDITLLSIYSGMSFVDLQNFTKKNIVGRVYIDRRTKSGIGYSFVITDEIYAILERNNYSFKKMGNQKYNIYFKKLCSQIDIFNIEKNGVKRFEKMKHKLNRSTCITNILSENHSIRTTLTLTGHTNTDAWKPYMKRGLTEEDVQTLSKRKI
jgi:integrase